MVGISVGGVQLLDKGPRALAFFTVWNWWLLTAYFALAALSSARVLLAAKGSSARKRAAAMQKADIIEKAAATMYHVAVPVSL